MTQAVDLFGNTPPAPEPPKPTNEELFLAFHERNPNVYKALVTLAIGRIHYGSNRGSIRHLFYDLRESPTFKTVTGDKYKLTNTFSPYYAELMTANGDVPKGYFILKR